MKTTEKITLSEQKEIKRLKKMQGRGSSSKYFFVLLMLIGLVVVNFFASALNSLITSIFPMFMREKVNSGLFAGVLNGFCYLGSTISSYGLGAIADNFGWTAVFLTLIGFAIISLITLPSFNSICLFNE